MSPEVLGLIAALLFGVSIGSFLNVVIWRLPQGLSVSSPQWSFCPNCKTRLGTLDLIPLVSFLALGCKCRTCKKPISWRYFTVELITGLLFLAVAFKEYAPHGVLLSPYADLLVPTVATIFNCLFVAVMVAVFFIDLDYFIIPNRLNFAGFLIGLGYWVAQSWMHYHTITLRSFGIALVPPLIGAVGYALLFHLISFAGYLYYTSQSIEHEDGTILKQTRSLGSRATGFVGGVFEDYAYLGARISGLKYISPGVRKFVETINEQMGDEKIDPEVSREEIASEIENEEEQTGMGQGDAKLAGAIGAFLLLPLALVSFFASVLMGGLVSIALMLFFSKKGRTAIPFGPYLVVGALLTLFFGQPVLDWYLGLMNPGSPAH